MGKAEIVQGLQDFIKELNEIPYDSSDYGLNPFKLDKLVERIKKVIKRLFGDSSEHLTDLNRILSSLSTRFLLFEQENLPQRHGVTEKRKFIKNSVSPCLCGSILFGSGLSRLGCMSHSRNSLDEQMTHMTLLCL
jgi:hypothetical protein